jgi:N-acetyl sugar amidotransferase
MDCQRCVMSSGTRGVTVFEDGTCSYCREYESRKALETRSPEERDRALQSVVERIQRAGRGRPYDALIGLSGGLDSTFAAFVARQHGLRLLGVHVDNGWNTKLAEENIQRTVDQLEIELIVETPSFECFRDLQLAFLRASVANAEIPTDHVIAAVLYREASRRGLKYLINGGNFATEGVTLRGGTGYNRDLRHIRAIHKRYGTRSLRTLPTIGIPRTLYYRYVRGIHTVRILNYVDYQRDAAVKVLSEKIGWTPYEGKHNESVYTRFFQSYILPNRFGLDKRPMHLSALICAGQLSREDALAELEKPPYSEPEQLERDMSEVLRKFELSRDEFDGIMQSPVRSHLDFPSNRLLFRFAHFLVRRGIRIGE